MLEQKLNEKLKSVFPEHSFEIKKEDVDDSTFALRILCNNENTGVLVKDYKDYSILEDNIVNTVINRLKSIIKK